MLNAYNFDQVEPVDADDIIDVSVFDFTDNETWLSAGNYPPEGLQNRSNNGLEPEPEDSEGSNGARRFIDTRTFTRPKKRNNRTSFESIIEALSPTAPDVWKKPSAPNLRDIDSNTDKERGSTNGGRESVPAMLKATPNLPVRCGIFGASGQESMEAFLNLSQSKGIDSFINLTEPEFADTIMNVSQPSDLGSSFADTTNCKDGFTREGSIVDSQILTDSMMKTSMFGDASDIRDFDDETFLKDVGYDDATLKRSGVFDERTFSSDRNSEKYEKPNLNSTFNTFTRRSAASLPRQSLPLDIEKQTINTTFVSSPCEEKPELDESLPQVETYRKKIPNGLNGTCVSQNQTLQTINITLDLNNDLSNADVDVGSDFSSAENLHSNTTITRATVDSTFDGPSDLRRELLEEVQRSTEKNLDSTYSRVSEDYNARVDVVNRNNTYRKNSSKFRGESLDKPVSLNLPPRRNDDKKYYTFTKKTNTADLRADFGVECRPSLGSLENTFCKPSMDYKKKLRAPRVLSKVPQLFQKSNPNLVSNGLKNFTNQRRSDMPNSKFGRTCQTDVPRNVEGALINKLLPLGRYKSGSEQRLVEVGGSVKEFLSKGACGSTESIESTQSAHSAPDLDDRLSVCSDSSHTSYNSRVINSAQLHYIARLQEESLKQISTPKPNRRVLENNWMDEERDLPSPILKGGSQELGTLDRAVETSSPLLSPVGSSARSTALTGNRTDRVPSPTSRQDRNNLAKEPEMLVRPTKHSGLENKTRLRAPTNWSAANRPSGTASGIPRPASRIPGPRFSRPSNTSNQTDWKRGCL